MDLRLVLVFLIFSIHCSHQSTNTAPPPALSLASIDVELDETQDRRTNLYPAGPLASCTDDDPARAYIQSVSPSSPCGAKCFQLEPCGTGNNSEFCLFFLASQGTLRYASAPKYTINVGCTDDVETPTTKSLTVTIVPNTPPTFNPPSPLTIAATIPGTSTKAGDVVYDVDADDIDGDPIYYTMSTNPSTPYLSIGSTDGKIRATNDLKFLCQTSIAASVTATDGKNPSIGPLKINFAISPANTAPTINNLDQTVTVDENVGAGFTVLKLGVVDPDPNKGLNFHIRSTSDAGLEQYVLQTTSTTATLKTKINPNYERADTRSAQFYIDVDDGYCKSKTYTLTVNINDINEPPLITPYYRGYYEVYEEDVILNTQQDVLDEDINDKHTFSKTGGANEFGVDAKSGDVYSLAPIDIDKNTVSKTYFVKKQVTDKGGLTSEGRVGIIVYDANDNPPYFKQNAYSFGATACTDPGTKVGSVSGDDDDSDWNNNDIFTFGGGAGKLAVMSNGDVVLTQPCLNGETSSGQATITDQGIYPGPLTGKPATLTLTCGPCPPPTPPATPAPATTTKAPTAAATTTTTPAPIKVGGGDDSINELLAWLIPAILGGLVWLALTAYLIYRYCCPCRNPCAGRCRRRPKPIKVEPKKEPKKPKPEKPKKVAPPPPPPPPPPAPAKPAPPPPPPPPPEPEPDPYIFGFWKEQYTDQDHLKKHVVREVKPAPIENMPSADVVPRGNAPPPDNLRLGNPWPGQQGQYKPPVEISTISNPGNDPALPAANAAQAAPKKNCVIQ